jgi:hypothetical protein
MYTNLDPVQDFTCCLCCKRDNPNFELCDRRFSCKSYWFYNIVASVLHLLNAVLMVVLFYIPDEDGVTQKDVCYQLYMPYASWTPVNGTDEFVITQKAVDTHTLSLHWLIVGFHALSFVFQIVVIFLDPKSSCKIKACVDYEYQDLVEKQNINPLRFVEYAISASIMLVCIALLTGVRNENEIISIAVLCTVCQLVGMIAEISQNRMVRIIAHATGWLSLMVSYGIIWLYYGIANYQGGLMDPPRSAPDIVHVVVIVLFLLFNSFGAIQLTQLCCRSGRWWTYVAKESELSYVFLSLVAKTLLGWLIYSNVLVMARECL